MLLTLHPDDFDKDSGRKKIIMALHELDAKVRDLENSIKNLKGQDIHFGKDVEDILKHEE